MAVIGMIGGLGPESTLDYYRMMIAKHRAMVKADRNPEIIIYSVDVYKLLDCFDAGKLDAAADILTSAVKVLHKAGADFGFMSANTPHIVFDKVKKNSPIPLVSIVEETCKAVAGRCIGRVGFLGTRFSMRSSFYQNEFGSNGIKVFVPNIDEQNYIHEKLETEIELGIFMDGTRDGLLKIVERMIRDDAIEGVILGCTELPLILTKDEFGIPFFNTSEIHVNSILKYYMQLDACEQLEGDRK
jgi:aspartate racemase